MIASDTLGEPAVRVSTYADAQRVFQEVIARVERDAATLFGGAINLDPLDGWERAFSFIQRFAVRRAGASAPVCNVFVKLFKFKAIGGDAKALPKRIARDYASTRDAHETFARFSHLGAVRPIACYPDLLAIVTEEAAGDTLDSYLQNHLTWAPSTAHVEAACQALNRLAEWIRVFQSSPAPGPAFTIDDRLEYVDVRLRRLVAGGRFRSSDRTAVLEHIQLLGKQIVPGALRRVRSHSDMSLGNILMTPERVVVLDFAMTSTDTELYDVAKVFLQLELLAIKPTFRRSVAKTLQGALLEGFGGTNTADPLFRLVMVQHTVNHLAALYARRVGFGARLYNAVVTRRHHDWLAREIQS